jgi:hypothetical protein
MVSVGRPTKGLNERKADGNPTRQRETLLPDVKESKKNKDDTYVDLCADILLGTLTQQLRSRLHISCTQNHSPK